MEKQGLTLDSVAGGCCESVKGSIVGEDIQFHKFCVSCKYFGCKTRDKRFLSSIALGAGSTGGNSLGLVVIGKKKMFQSWKLLLQASHTHSAITVNVLDGTFTCCCCFS